MRSLGLLTLTVSLSELASAFSGGHRDIHHDHASHHLQKRNIVYDGHIADSYDYVIIGGGTAGLTVASRLSEDSNATVLVLEAGDTGDAVADRINTPVMAYYAGLPGTTYDWAYKTVAQPSAGGRNLPWPRGKVLGGSSAMNGMYHIRPSKVEVDAWSSLIGSDKWNWDSMFETMKESETFTPPSSDVQTEANIQYVASSRGTNGPVHATYPGFELPVVGNWTQTLGNIGVEVNDDAYNGEGWGAFIATSSINPENWTRSYARSAYIDPLSPRPNLSILPNATATRIIFDSSNSNNVTATGVEWAAYSGATKQTVTVKKEVILAGGAVGSPHVLMLSGVGPKDVLQAAGVNVQVELPGVGQHLQDHISTAVTFKTSTDTAASLHAAGQNSPSFLSFINSATAYVNITDLLGDSASDFKTQIANELSSSVSSLVPSTDATVIKGYQTIYNTTLNTFFMSPLGQVEILLALTGSGSDSNVLQIQAALQHPFSQGRLYITTNDAFTQPAIDPQYLSHTADTVILREGLKLARKIAATAPLSAVIGDEITPGTTVSSDDDWDSWLATNIGTEFHPSCSCAMLPREQGGVVDENLKVYGTGNVRVVDASVFPVQFSAHLQAPTYGLAEQAAKLIRATYNGVGWPSAAGNSTLTSTSSSTTASPSQTAQHDHSGALSLSSGSALALAAAGVLASLFL